jgi:hypothetical protein
VLCFLWGMNWSFTHKLSERDQERRRKQQVNSIKFSSVFLGPRINTVATHISQSNGCFKCSHPTVNFKIFTRTEPSQYYQNLILLQPSKYKIQFQCSTCFPSGIPELSPATDLHFPTLYLATSGIVPASHHGRKCFALRPIQHLSSHPPPLL